VRVVDHPMRQQIPAREPGVSERMKPRAAPGTGEVRQDRRKPREHLEIDDGIDAAPPGFERKSPRVAADGEQACGINGEDALGRSKADGVDALGEVREHKKMNRTPWIRLLDMTNGRHCEHQAAHFGGLNEQHLTWW